MATELEKRVMFPSGRPKRYWITEQARMTQARKSWKTLIDIRDGRVHEQAFTPEGVEYSVAASVRDVREAAKSIMAYAVGLPKQALELTGEDGGPLKITWESDE